MPKQVLKRERSRVVKKLNVFGALIVMLFFCDGFAAKGDEPIKVGNFALPTSQQPGPLLGFGQNIVDKHDAQVFLFPDFLIGPCKRFSELAPSILYGIRDDLSLFIELPIAASFCLASQCSSGPEDLIVQLEYAFYTNKNFQAVNQCTAIGALLLPSGNERKDPPTGYGSPSFFLAGTASHLSNQWYCYLSPGMVLTTEHNHHTKVGNIFGFQTGFGKNITYTPDSMIFMWMIELSIIHSQKRKVDGIIDQNSGGTVVMLCPSLWFSTDRFIMQAGIAPIISERLFGCQLKDSMYVVFNFGWKFH